MKIIGKQLLRCYTLRGKHKILQDQLDSPMNNDSDSS